jgi:hypothetical protein
VYTITRAVHWNTIRNNPFVHAQGQGRQSFQIYPLLFTGVLHSTGHKWTSGTSITRMSLGLSTYVINILLMRRVCDSVSHQTFWTSHKAEPGTNSKNTHTDSSCTTQAKTPLYIMHTNETPSLHWTAAGQCTALSKPNSIKFRQLTHSMEFSIEFHGIPSV